MSLDPQTGDSIADFDAWAAEQDWTGDVPLRDATPKQWAQLGQFIRALLAESGACWSHSDVARLGCASHLGGEHHRLVRPHRCVPGSRFSLGRSASGGSGEEVGEGLSRHFRPRHGWVRTC